MWRFPQLPLANFMGLLAHMNTDTARKYSQFRVTQGTKWELNAQEENMDGIFLQ